MSHVTIAKADALDWIVSFLWPERMSVPPDDHPSWDPSDGPYDWSSDTLQEISDYLELLGMVPD